ncbi:hypothetical protein M8J76_005517 [Diaphorina citri]|nr:hypothetical protein M8J76_005517 [Diaphorina citri]
MEKQKVKQYINSKLEAQLQEKEEYRKMREEEKKNKSKKANIMIQVYRKQDEKRLREKLDRKQQFVLKELENIERLRRVKSEVNVGRDPRRVQKPTCGWKNKISGEAEESGESTRDVTFITHVPHLKVPDWRQDVKFEDQIIL